MKAGRPSILWIVTTQWRASAAGYAGDPNARTPALDALAAESVNFSQAVTPHPLGPQARAALLTGRLCPENGVRDYWDPLPRAARTIAHELRERGYATAFFGKWHLYQRDRSLPFVGEAHAKIVVPPEWRGGFEFWEGFEGGFLLNDPWLHGSRLPAPTRFEGYQSEVVCGRAAGWMAERGGRKTESSEQSAVSSERGAEKGPWFCVVSLEAPHPPYHAPAAGVRPRDPREIALPPNVPRGGDVEQKAREELAGYYAHIEATDRAIGRLVMAVDGGARLATSAFEHVEVNALHQTGARKARASTPAEAERREQSAGQQNAGPRQALRQTMVAFTSVHGDMHGAHGLFRKAWPYEESIRVPLLIRGGEGEAGSKDESPVSLVDLAAMTLAWADGKPPVADRRYSLISMPTGSEIPWQCPHAWRGVRTKTRKLVLREERGPSPGSASPSATRSGPSGSPQAGSGLRPWLFFDLERDPWERENLAQDACRRTEIKDLSRWILRSARQ